MGFIPYPDRHLELPDPCDNWAETVRDSRRGSVLFCHTNVQHFVAVSYPEQAHLSAPVSPCRTVKFAPTWAMQQAMAVV